MSTKTLRKRISLVAVSALGFGMLSVVAAPSANAEAAFSVISVGTVPAARAGATVTIPVTVSISSHAASETMTIAAKVISAPTGSAFAADAAGPDGTNAVNSATYPWFAFGDSDGTLSTSTGTSITSGTTAATTSYIGRHIAGTTAAGDLAAAGVGGVLATAIRATLDSTANTSTTATFYLNVKPDVAGSYSFLISTSGVAAHGSYVAGDTSTTMTLTTAGAPATATIAAVGGSNATNGTGSKGALFKVSFKDAAGLATTLGADEAFTVTASAGYIAKASLSAGVFTSANPTSLTSVSFGASDVYNGNGFFNANVSTAATTVVLNGAGAGALSSAITASASYATATGLAASTTAAQTTTFAGRGGTAVTSGWYVPSSGTQYVPTTTTSNTIELTYTGETTANYGYLTVTDTNGLISGIGTASSLAYDRAYTQAAMTTAGADYTTVAIPHAVCANGVTCYAVTDAGGSTIGNVVGQTASTGSTAFGVTVYGPATTLTSATAGSVTYTVRMRDQFKLGVANTGIAVTFAGRNSAKASPTIVTDASGYATYAFTDSGTTGTTDVLTFTSGSKTATATINYGTATAGSVLVATPSTGAVTSTTVAGVDSYPRAYSEISAGDGVEAGAVTVTALVKDANANVMSGMPVVWTVTGAGCAITSTTATTYTAANGQATASLYGWIAGNCVVKATSGGQSDEANSYWAQTGTAEVRSISATVTGGSIVVVAKDRLGNPIAGVPLKATRTSGSGSFGGSSSATGTTDSAGSQEFIVSNGDAKVTITFNDATAATYGQSDALTGLVDGTTATNIFTATTAGTALLAEAGVGATFAAAGVNSLTVEAGSADTAQAAADAAAEATDAANAATDAANAAAEAADAATAAAQDAADAVAALSTQVSEMVDALKKQITALTNLVIKIQKKVKA